MGFSTRDNGIRTFWPDNTEDTLYFSGSSTLSEIYDKAIQHFGAGVTLDSLKIRSEHIQTDCIGYDQYDQFDYTTFIVVELEK